MANIVGYYERVSIFEKGAVDNYLDVLGRAREAGAAIRNAMRSVLNRNGGEDFTPLHDPHKEREDVSRRFLEDPEFRDKVRNCLHNPDTCHDTSRSGLPGGDASQVRRSQDLPNH